MRIGKSTSDGWNSFASTVDAAASTVSADISGFSAYGVVPGLQALAYGSVPGMEARYYDWPLVSYLQVATDPAGAVYVAGIKDAGDMVPVADGGFVARLNVDLSVQWVRPLPTGYDPSASSFFIRVDQQGNAWVAYDTAGFPNKIAVVGFNANGSTRSGFPVSWNSTSFDRTRGLASDATGNLHVLGRATSSAFDPIERASYTVVRGSDGSFAKAPTTFSLPGGVQTTSVTVWDMALDYAGNVYFTSSWFGNGSPGFGSHVSSYLANTLGARAGFPKAQSGFANFIGKAVNSQRASPLLLVPVTENVPDQLQAFNVANGSVQAGFPAPISGVASISYSVVDIVGNTWLMGRANPSSSYGKNWLGSFNSSGAMRSGFPRVFGGDAATVQDLPHDIAVDPAGTAYVVGLQTLQPGTPQPLRRASVIRQPAL